MQMWSACKSPLIRMKQNCCCHLGIPVVNTQNSGTFCAYFAEKSEKIIVLACYSFCIAILWAYFHYDPYF